MVHPTKCGVPEHSKQRQKAFCNETRKEIEENKRKGKTRDLFKKVGNSKGTFQPKLGTIKKRKWLKPNKSRRDQEEMEKIHRRTVQKKALMTWIAMTGKFLKRWEYQNI